MAKELEKQSSNSELSAFLARSAQLPQRSNSAPRKLGRMIFALDATASRQASWDRACALQGEMFIATEQLGGLQLQLCYYRGFKEFIASDWLVDSRSLLQHMHRARCRGGYTQLQRVLDHALQQHSQEPIKAVIIIADAVEESIDALCAKAGKMGVLNIPLFMFQEGRDSVTQQCFQQMATLSRGAYAHFDERSAATMIDLLGAAATFAAGGSDALQKLGSASAQQLLRQMRSDR
jgi:hypothetical protein